MNFREKAPALFWSVLIFTASAGGKGMEFLLSRSISLSGRGEQAGWEGQKRD